MPVTSTPIRIAVKMLLNNGTDSSGNIKTISQSLGAMSLSGYDDTKAMAIIAAIAPCLTKTIHSVKKSVDYTLTD